MKHLPLHFLIGLLATLLFTAACSDDPDSNDVLPNVNANSSDDRDAGDDAENHSEDTDTDDIDADADADADSDAEEDADTQEDAEENDADTGEDSPCGPVVDLGVIESGYNETLTIHFDELEDLLSTTCNNAADGPEAIFRFTLEEAGTLEVLSDALLAIEVRVASCEEPVGEICREEEFSVHFQQNQPLFLVVEALNEPILDEIELAIEFTAPEQCDEVGISECLDENENTIRTCNTTWSSPDVPRWNESICPTGCENDRCLGDSCETPLVVDGALSIGGNHSVLFNNHSHIGVAGCGPDGSAGGFLNGRELVFELPDLTTEHQVIVDTVNATMDFSFLIKQSCDDDALCVDYGDDSAPYIFTPAEDGTYYLFAEVPHDVEGAFFIEIEIESL